MARLQPHDEKILKLEADVNRIDKLLTSLRQSLLVKASTTESRYINNIVFTWTGGTLTLSWSAGYLQEQTGTNQQLGGTTPNNLIVYPISAGSRVVSASTYYWVAWNIPQQQMIVSTDIVAILNDVNSRLIGNLYTGTGAETGTAGGGGSNGAGTGYGVETWKNF
jgi:hypothetical protein